MIRLLSQPGQAQLERIAQKLIWWKTPSEALAYPDRFLAQVMTLGTWNDVETVRSVVGQEGFREVLQHPPAGVFDEASWAYWHHVYHIEPVPPLPKRMLPC
jgi:hypothetical protein